MLFTCSDTFPGCTKQATLSNEKGGSRQIGATFQASADALARLVDHGVPPPPESQSTRTWNAKPSLNTLDNLHQAALRHRRRTSRAARNPAGNAAAAARPETPQQTYFTHDGLDSVLGGSGVSQ